MRVISAHLHNSIWTGDETSLRKLHVRNIYEEQWKMRFMNNFTSVLHRFFTHDDKCRHASIKNSMKCIFEAHTYKLTCLLIHLLICVQNTGNGEEMRVVFVLRNIWSDHRVIWPAMFKVNCQMLFLIGFWAYFQFCFSKHIKRRDYRRANLANPSRFMV